MVSAISSSSGASGVVSSGTGNSNSSQIATLQRQMTAVQKQLDDTQKSQQTDATQKLQQQLADQIAALQAQIAQLQAAAAQQAGQQTTQPPDSADTSTSQVRSVSSTLGSVIDTYA